MQLVQEVVFSWRDQSKDAAVNVKLRLPGGLFQSNSRPEDWSFDQPEIATKKTIHAIHK
jgi:hypothetical protein